MKYIDEEMNRKKGIAEKEKSTEAPSKWVMNHKLHVHLQDNV